MAGLLNTNQPPVASAAPSPVIAAAQSQGGTSPNAPVSDPILKQIEAGLEAKIPQQFQAQYKAAVMAGMQIMFGSKTHAAMQQALSASSDMGSNISKGIASLATVIYKESNRKVTPPAIALASITLACHAMDYAEKTMGYKVTPQEAGGVIQATTNAVMAKFGVGPQQVQKAVAAGQAQQAKQAPPAAAPVGA